MKELVFDSGVRTYTVNGGVQISFNPADLNFVEKIFRMMTNIKDVAYDKAERDKLGDDTGELFEYADTVDRACRKEVDAVFGDGVADAIFPCALTALSDGLPVWLNFAMAILDEVDETTVEQQKLANPRLDKYLAKYAKYKK